MQISRRVLLACVATTILLPNFLPAADTEAQIKARQALERAMGKTETAPIAEPPPVAKPAVPQAPASVSKPVAPAPAPAVAAPRRPPLKKASEADIEKAREALRQKMSEMESQPAPANPARVQMPAVVQPSAPPVVVPVESPLRQAPPASNANVEKAREALRQKMNELEQQPAGAQPGTFEAPAVARPTTPSVTSPAETFFPPPSAANANAEKAREALRQKMSEMEPQQPAPTVEPVQPAVTHKAAPEFEAAPTTKPVAKAPVNKAEKLKPVVKPKSAQAWQPLQGPPSGLSPEKEQQLRALLDDYKADKLTPEQYHAERAKILAAP